MKPRRPLKISRDDGDAPTDVAALQAENAALRAKVMAYVDRSAQMRDSIVRMRELLRHQRRVLLEQAKSRERLQRELTATKAALARRRWGWWERLWR